MICIKCNEMVDDNLNFCKNCGEKLKPIKICKSCKRIIDLDSQYCGYCGENLAEVVSITFSIDGCIYETSIDKNLKAATYKNLLGLLISECLKNKTNEELASLKFNTFDKYGNMVAFRAVTPDETTKPFNEDHLDEYIFDECQIIVTFE